MTDSDLLVPLTKDGDKPPLFVVPSAGSTPLSLVKLARSLSPGRPVHSFVFAGMDEGQSAHTSIEEMASAYLEEILEVQESGPYYICGHCFGGIVALDIAVKLEARGEEVAVLALLESFAPHGPGEEGRHGVPDGQDATSVVAAEMKKLLEIVGEYNTHQLSRLPPKIAERFGGIVREHIEMGFRYRATSIAAPIALLRTSTFNEAAFESWKQISRGEFSDQIVPGGTYTMLGPPHVEILGAALAKATGDS